MGDHLGGCTINLPERFGRIWRTTRVNFSFCNIMVSYCQPRLTMTHRTHMTKLLLSTAVVGLCVVSNAAILDPSTLVFRSPATSAVYTAFQNATASTAFGWFSNAVASFNASQNELIVYGQVEYQWQILNPVTSQVGVGMHSWDVSCHFLPTFSGAVKQSLSATGYFVSTPNADYRAEQILMTDISGSANALTGTIASSGGINGAWSLSGASNYYSLAVTDPSPINIAPGGSAMAYLSPWAYDCRLMLRPAGGATYFAQGSIVSLTIDYPITLKVTPVPEPSSLGFLTLSVFALANRRPSRKRLR